MESDTFRSISKASKGEYKEKGSKFFAFTYPVISENEIKDILKDLKKKYYDARHFVYAYRLGADMKKYRCSDDGEPSNSSGPPVLGQILSNELTNIMIVVVRYFGGTKLGVPGLINAYKSAAADAISNNEIIIQYEMDVFTIEFGYLEMNSVMKIIKEDNPEQLNHSFDNTCTIELLIRKSQGQAIRSRFKKIEGLSIK